MANQKTYSRRKKEEDEKKSAISSQIDLIPKYVQQPRTRSPGCPKRRTDFSLFFCSQLSPPCSSSLDFSPESHSSRDGFIEAKHDVLQGRSKEIPSFHLILCCQSQHEGDRFSPEYSEHRGKEAESSRSMILESWNNPLPGSPEYMRHCAALGYINENDVYEQKDDIERTMESAPEKLHRSGSKDISQASIRGERLTCSDSDNASISGHVSVQCCGTDESVMLQSVKSSSRFQDGLLRRRGINPSKSGYSVENDQPFGKPKSLSSSKVEVDILNGGRGKRKRKPKVHFDELANPEESVKKVRRLKIMRYLGLAAPAGSPFILPQK